SISCSPPHHPCIHSFPTRRSSDLTQKLGLEFHNWKRYKGGEAEDIYVGTLDPLAFTLVTNYEGKDAFPMWAPDGRIYFVTDRWGDRKSTRLNSSHQIISYAVFCLK